MDTSAGYFSAFDIVPLEIFIVCRLKKWQDLVKEIHFGTCQCQKGGRILSYAIVIHITLLYLQNVRVFAHKRIIFARQVKLISNDKGDLLDFLLIPINVDD